MKTLLILSTLLVSLSAFSAQNYDCYVGGLKLELKSDGKNSTLIIRDSQTREFIYNGIIHEVVQSGDLSDLMFEIDNGRFLQLRFKTRALDSSEEVLFGLARGYTGRRIIDNSMRCAKKIVI